jgi:hypothetical protein
MKARLAIITTGLALTLVNNACLADGQKTKAPYGDWKVTAVASAGPVTAMSGEAAALLVGKILVLKPKTLQFAGRICQPTYGVTEESADDFLEEYRVNLKELNLRQPVIRFEADCTDVFIRDANTILFTWKGYFLEAKKLATGK